MLSKIVLASALCSTESKDVSRFAREMKAHVLGIALLRERGVRLLSAADGQDLTEGTDEMTEGMVTIMAVFAQIEKKRLVKKLRAARDRKSPSSGRGASLAIRYVLPRMK